MHLQVSHHKKQIMKGVAYRHKVGVGSGGLGTVQSDVQHIESCCCKACLLSARTGPHIRGFSGLYIPTPGEGHSYSE